MSENGFAMLDEKAQEEMNNVLAPFTRAWEKYEIISIALDHSDPCHRGKWQHGLG